MANELMQIGEVAKKSNVNIQTLRYYEKRKILNPKHIKDSGYRLYGEDAIKTVLFIKNAQELGFKLEDIKELLNLRTSTSNRCQKVRVKATEKLVDVEEKIKMLRWIERTLKKLVRNCEANKTSNDCPIIDNMETK